MAFADKPLREVLDAFSAATPTPGGGSACAAAGAFGTALLRAAAEGARLTIDSNLGALTDAGYVTLVREEFQMMADRAENAVTEAARLLRVR